MMRGLFFKQKCSKIIPCLIEIAFNFRGIFYIIQMDTKPNIKQAVPFFMVADMGTSLSFYVDGLGFTMLNQWKPRDKIEWCWLQRDSTAIMLQERREKGQQAADPPQKLGVGVSICFQCEDALALYHEFTGRGLKINEPFVGNGMWVVCLADVDGYKLDFESVTDAPKETKYSEWELIQTSNNTAT
jgi:lactoylglutathione lyase